MNGDFTFAVRHRAAPQGSKDLRTKANGAKYMKESSDRVKPFRVAIRRAACGADGRPMVRFTGPVLVGIVFEFKRAQSNVDDYPTGRNIGDIDKLTRAVLDGLTQADVIEDDSYVVGWLGTGEPSKIWGPEDRVTVTVRSVVSLTSSIVDFAEQVGRPLDAWQRVVLDEVVRVPARNPFEQVDLSKLPPGTIDRTMLGYPALDAPAEAACCNTVDHKSCLMMGTENCPCPNHCPA